MSPLAFLEILSKMFRSRNIALPLAWLLGSTLAAQNLPYHLNPGDLVVADTAGSTASPAIRVLRSNGQLDVILAGSPLNFPADVYVDRDGSILVSNYETQFSSNNQILRLDPLGGPILPLNSSGLADNFTMVRDAKGDLVVADGYAGLARIDDQGNVNWYSSGNNFEIAIGVELDYDGRILLAEAWNYISGTAAPGFIYHVDQAGNRVVFAQNPHLLYSPNDLALAPDGSVLVTNYSQGAPTSDQPRLVQVDRDGTVRLLAEAGLLQKPKGVVVGDFGEIFLADTDDESVLQWDGFNHFNRVLWDLSDGLSDGHPVDRPFGLALVPSLWLRTEYLAHGGSSTTMTLESKPDYWGLPVALAASTSQAATPLDLIWPSSPRTSFVNLARATVAVRHLPANGAPLVFTNYVPSALIGMALHLQAFLPHVQLASNYIALPVK
jgi:sugar lactone lactonase YvrE